MGRLQGKTALVTGAASGIGRRTTERFVEEGARVAMTDINAEGLAAAAAPLGDAVITLHHDITDEQSWIDVVGQAVDQLGSINILVNSAGTGKATNIEDTTLEDWHRVMAINADGTFLGCKHGVIAMKETGGGAIVNLSSVSGLIGGHNMTAYNASKGAVRLLTKSVALHCARKGYNIRCNSLHPGGTETGMFDETLRHRGITPEAFRDMAKTRNPLGRLAQPIEIAHGALFLASDESSFMTGSELALDGGYAAR